ncbi:MAG: SgcJ/EcaC family oxidoreductase [Janthinobacterium lividum]
MSQVSEKDAAEIRAAISGLDRAWNTHDMKAYVSYMTEDANWVNVVGMWWKGKDQVYRAHEAFHRTIFKNRQLHEPETVSLRSITPDVVIATIIQTADGFTTPDGHTEPAGRAALTEVYVRREGKWLLTEGHNTTIVEAAQRSNPVRD